MSALDRESSIPLFLQIKEEVSRDIFTNYAPGDRLPSELEYVSRFKTSSLTVARALQDLQREGIITRQRGRGSFVASRDRKGIELVALLREADEETVNHLGRMVLALKKEAPGDREPVYGTILTAPLPSPSEFHSQCVGRGVGGVVLFGFAPEHYSFVIAVARKMPAVLMNKPIPGFASDVVMPDEKGGAVQIVEHYRAAGYRRFALAAEWLSWHTGAKARLDGFREVLSHAGLACDEGLVGEWDDGLRERLKAAWGSGSGPEAVIAYPHGVARGVLSLAESAGVRPKIATFTQRWESVRDVASRMDVLFTDGALVAAAAAKRLRQRIANPLLAPEQICISPELVSAGERGG